MNLPKNGISLIKRFHTDASFHAKVMSYCYVHGESLTNDLISRVANLIEAWEFIDTPK